MKIIIYKKSRRDISISEIIKETEKTYKVKRIDKLPWRIQGYNSLVNKDDVIFSGELTEENLQIVQTYYDNMDVLDAKIRILRENTDKENELLLKELK